MSNEKLCDGGPKLIFACSGAADVGALSDLAARQMMKNGIGKMFCLAGIGGNVEGILKTTKSASKIVAIDGCPLDCVKKNLERAGFESYEHIRITDEGFDKGKTEVNQESINRIVFLGKEKLGD